MQSASSVTTVLGTNCLMKKSRGIGLDESRKMVRTFLDYGYTEVDTAYRYSEGEAEAFFGSEKESFEVDLSIGTKANCWEGKRFDETNLRAQLETSLARLKRNKVDVFYLHQPCQVTPIRETLAAVNKLYNEEKFSEFGICNYRCWQVAEICTLCRENSWVLPTVYQGMYNILTRGVERELLDCLRHYGIRFYAFNPLAGGILTGKFDVAQEDKGNLRKYLQNWYWKKEYFDAIEVLRSAIISHYGTGKISLIEAAYRWLYHHSALDGERGDAVLVGSSSAKQLIENLGYTKKGPLDAEIVQVIQDIWRNISHDCPHYAEPMVAEPQHRRKTDYKKLRAA